MNFYKKKRKLPRRWGTPNDVSSWLCCCRRCWLSASRPRWLPRNPCSLRTRLPHRPAQLLLPRYGIASLGLLVPGAPHRLLSLQEPGLCPPPSPPPPPRLHTSGRPSREERGAQWTRSRSGHWLWPTPCLPSKRTRWKEDGPHVELIFFLDFCCWKGWGWIG